MPARLSNCNCFSSPHKIEQAEGDIFAEASYIAVQLYLHSKLYCLASVNVPAVLFINRDVEGAVPYEKVKSDFVG